LLPQVISQEAEDPIIPEIEKDLITIFQSACDPNCCGGSIDNRACTLPCCQSCSNLVNFTEIHKIPFAIPRGILQPSSSLLHTKADICPDIKALTILRGLVSKTMFNVISIGLNFVRQSTCSCGDVGTTLKCCSPPWEYRPRGIHCNKWVECDNGVTTRSLIDKKTPLLTPTLIEYENGEFEFITQTEERTLLREKACYCEGAGFTTQCDKKCIFTRKRLRASHDEL
jgi:hypothetical protein